MASDELNMGLKLCNHGVVIRWGDITLDGSLAEAVRLTPFLRSSSYRSCLDADVSGRGG
jgi:hypothetical protein